MSRAVLHAHPDWWTVGMERHLPPEERTRLRDALVGFALEWLGPRGVEVEEPEGTVEDTEEQRRALAAWRARDPGDPGAALSRAFDAVVCGALWDSPVFRAGGRELRLHHGLRLTVEGTDGKELPALAEKHALLLRDR